MKNQIEDLSKKAFVLKKNVFLCGFLPKKSEICIQI